MHSVHTARVFAIDDNSSDVFNSSSFPRDQGSLANSVPLYFHVGGLREKESGGKSRTPKNNLRLTWGLWG